MRWLFIGAMLATAACGTQKRTVPPEPAPTSVTFDGANTTDRAALLKHGERLTHVLGCSGCHGADLEGNLWDNDPKEYGVMWASNLTRAIPTMTDAQLRDLLTNGVHPRRRELWLMPSQLFQHLSAADLDALMDYLRTLPLKGELSPDPKPGPRAMREIKSGEVKTAAQLVRERKAVGPIDLGAPYALGRYITRVTCAECHGPKLEGQEAEEGKTPDLIVAGGYTRAEFETLMTKGIPSGGRKFKNPLMGEVARSRFTRFTPHERDALYAYLKARAEQPQ